MASYAITGASRGIGLELTRQLLDLPASQVKQLFVITRSEPSGDLASLIRGSSGRVESILAAVDDTASVQKAAAELESMLNGEGLDCLVNNAAIAAPYSSGGIETMSPDHLMKILDTNVAGPQRVTTAFLPLLKKGKQKKVINISSALGSIAWSDKWTGAPTQAYKTSKTALNMLNKLWANEYAKDGFTFLCISPGWLKTDLGGSSIADLDVHVGVAEVKRIIIEANPKVNGQFVDIHVPGMKNSKGMYHGEEIPW